MRHIDFYRNLVLDGNTGSGGTGGGGGITPTGTKTITTNGKHDVTAFATADVQVPIPDAPTGKKVIEVTKNGVSTHDVAAFAQAEVSVAVPIPPEPTGEKVVNITSNGTSTEDVREFESVHIVTSVPEPSGTKTITENGTHDVKAFASVNVNVPTGGGTGGGDVEALVKYPSYSEHGNLVLDLPNVTELRGYAFYKCFALGEIRLENISKISGYCFAEAEYLRTVSAPKVTSITGGAFNKTKNLKKLVLPSLVEIWPTVFDGSGIETLDMLGGQDSKIKCRFRWTGAVFKSLVIRSNEGIASLESGVDFLPTTSIYVPDELVEQYRAATNWSKYASQIQPLSTYQEV